jgi:hypothetical protein
MITLEHAYILVGLMFLAFAILTLRDSDHPTRIRSAVFWGLIAASMLFGSWLGGLGNGLLVLALVAVGGLKALGVGRPPTTTPDERRESAAHRRNALFIPALIVPLVAVGGTLAAKHTSVGAWLISPTQTTLIALGLGCILALVAAMAWLRPPVMAPVQEGRRLMDSIGWAALLPQMLASLGAVFLAADVGGVVGELVLHGPQGGDAMFGRRRGEPPVELREARLLRGEVDEAFVGAAHVAREQPPQIALQHAAPPQSLWRWVCLPWAGMAGWPVNRAARPQCQSPVRQGQHAPRPWRRRPPHNDNGAVR